MQLFYNPEISDADESVTFTKEESRHIIKVLRKSLGDQLTITNGKGYLFYSSITSSDPKRCVVTIERVVRQPRHPYNLHLVVAPTKMNDRYEWFLEKATEIGVDSITPVICDNSERKVIKAERYEKVIIAAMKQSLHCYLPRLNPTIAYKDFISNTHHGERFIAHCEESTKNALKEVLKPNSEITILIGPEGDFSPQEIEIALTKNFIPVSLGNTRLRTETAAIVACHTAALLNE